MKFLVLYEELATYFVNCLNHFAESENCEILVFSKQINQIAPFEFKQVHKNITLLEREKFSEEEIKNKISRFNPDFVYLSGWIFKPYLKYIQHLKLKNVIIGFDNQYNGSLKQRVGALYFQLKWKPFIKAAFVPGEKQVQFAKKLGFADKFISKNVYCCDTKLYNDYYDSAKSKKQEIPKRFLFVGRYVEEKGISDLWKAFIEIQNENSNEWELWCVGKGPLPPVNHPKIKHLGFVQPTNFLSVIENTGVFVLPSSFEPWGVVLHEFACAGYPIISTKNVGSCEVFLKDNENGFLIESNNYLQLKST
ncbi:MAG: glycosyltransferase family 4 protein, partial [Bacteroidia bacterium]|nr:glycosyltransferase family 4 protein [Bacteroidia bacterium]